MNNNLFNEIKNDSLIKLSDSSYQLIDYVQCYYNTILSPMEADEMYNALNQPRIAPINSEIKVKVTKGKAKFKKSTKLVTK